MIQCPNCNRRQLSPWPWQDGGYKGLQCYDCGTQWWSNSFGDRAAMAEQLAVASLMEALTKLPDDAITDENLMKRYTREDEDEEEANVAELIRVAKNKTDGEPDKINGEPDKT